MRISLKLMRLTASKCSKEPPSALRWKGTLIPATCGLKPAKDILSGFLTGVECSVHPERSESIGGNVVAPLFFRYS
jgi:hypothetical protein